MPDAPPVTTATRPTLVDRLAGMGRTPSSPRACGNVHRTINTGGPGGQAAGRDRRRRDEGPEPMPRRSKVEDSAARTALLDAAEAIMVEDGYAAVSIRRIASQAGLNSALVYYYFDTMDGLFVAL